MSSCKDLNVNFVIHSTNDTNDLIYHVLMKCGFPDVSNRESSTVLQRFIDFLKLFKVEMFEMFIYLSIISPSILQLYLKTTQNHFRLTYLKINLLKNQSTQLNKNLNH